MLRFMHLPTVIFMPFSLCAVCKMSVTLALFEQYDSQCTQTAQNTESPVSYSVYFLFNYIILNICEKHYNLRYKYALFFNPFSNDLKCLNINIK